MSRYAIGDVQGCFAPLTRLLERLNFSKQKDELFFVGDLVNRGPTSLETLRFMRENQVKAVLGNHDIYALARHFGLVEKTKDDTLQELLDAPDANLLMDWLLARPMVIDLEGQKLVHAGFLPAWTDESILEEAKLLTTELQKNPEALLSAYFHKPRPIWSRELPDQERAIAALAIFVRIRYVNQEGLPEKGSQAPEFTDPDKNLLPWFLYPNKRKSRPVFGHWASLGLSINADYAAIDTGCVWGHALTALDLDKGHVSSVFAGPA